MEKTIQKEINYSSWELIKDVFVLIRPYRSKFWSASFLRFVRDLVSLYPAFAFASIITLLTNGDSFSLIEIYRMLALFLVAIFLRALTNYYAKVIGLGVAERICLDSNVRAMNHMLKLDMAWHEKENSGSKIQKIQNAGRAFYGVIYLWFLDIISVIVHVVAINIIMAGFGRVVTISLTVFCFTYFFISTRLKKRVVAAVKEVNIEEEKSAAVIFEGINNIRTVKVMSMAQVLMQHLVNNTSELFAKIKKRVLWFQMRQALLMFFTPAFKIGMLAFIIYGISQGRYEVGFLVLFNSYFGDLSTAIDELAESDAALAAHKVSIARMKAILNEPVTIDKKEGKVSFPTDWQKIRVENVSFAYEDNQVLDDVSFEINRGEKIGIVGLSGAGKSTLFKLLLKEREEFTGHILFDDTSIKDIYKPSYFEKVSVVLQDTEVFNFSLKENITITNSTEIENQNLLNKSLDTAHLGEVAQKLPQGLDTLIGEKGVKLSGGERQRLGLARAIFKQPDILLLDEATSHLDIESEEKIRDSLHQFFENITAVVIAHRLTTIKEMDKILVLEDGKIIEEGSFAKLYKKKGRFYELWEKQKI